MGRIAAPLRRGILVEELAHAQGRMRSTGLIWCWDPDPADPGMFARSDHCDHIHWGMDG